MDKRIPSITKQNACDVSCFPVTNFFDITVSRIHSCLIDPRRGVCEPRGSNMNANVVADKFTPTTGVLPRPWVGIVVMKREPIWNDWCQCHIDESVRSYTLPVETESKCFRHKLYPANKFLVMPLRLSSRAELTCKPYNTAQYVLKKTLHFSTNK